MQRRKDRQMASNSFNGLFRKIYSCGLMACAIWGAAALANGPSPSFPGFYVGASFALPNGQQLIGGGISVAESDAQAYGYSFAVGRLNADGTPDLSFNGIGFVAVPIWGYYEFVAALAMQPDGKIIVGGNVADPIGRDDPGCYPADCETYPALRRLNADGTVDRSFNGGKGQLIIAIGDANSGGDVEEFGRLTALVLEPDGKIVIYDGTRATARVSADGTLDRSFIGTNQIAHELPSDVAIEYHNASLDHYFMTWVPNEIAKLDEGTVIKGWARTGFIIKTYTTTQALAGTSPVCRFYMPPALGDSHFFGRGIDECDATRQNHPAFVLEDSNFMFMSLPSEGVCLAGTTPVYRVFSNRPDANHRYMTAKLVRDDMVAKGWVAEGDGRDLVVMCAPQ